MNGVIKNVMKEKGFGFITGEDGKDIYFAKGANEAIFDTLNPNDKVTFETIEGAKGLNAVNIAIAA